MKCLVLAILLSTLSVPVFAQSVPATNQALSDQLVFELNESVRLRAMLVDAQHQIKELQDKLPKDEPKQEGKK